MDSVTHAEIIVRAPIQELLKYRVPQHLMPKVFVGSRVLVPLKNRYVEGVIFRLFVSVRTVDSDNPPETLLPIYQVTRELAFPSDLVNLVMFISNYYLVPPGDALGLMLPKSQQTRLQSMIRLSAQGQILAKGLTEVLLPAGTESLSSAEKSVLQDLAERSGKSESVQFLKRRFLKLGLHIDLTKVITKLVQMGLVTKEEEIKNSIREKEQIIQLGIEALSTHHDFSRHPIQEVFRRAPIQAAILELMKKEGPLSSKTVQKRIPGSRSAWKVLLQKGYLVTVPSISESEDVVHSKEGGACPSVVSLTEEQQQALQPIFQAIRRKSKDSSASSQTKQNQSFLLYGVTGSGKTEVYMQAIEEVLRQGRTAIVLVPEIALTPQLSARFQERFGRFVGVLHSGLSLSERRKVWQELAKGEKRIALGARSALFAPLQNLGIIIVDEEHDASFKQQEDVWYHGRDLALVRGQFADAPVILGSATPSLESFALVESGKLTPLILTKRVHAASMPQVQIIDVKNHLISPEQGFISAPLMTAIEETLAKKEQVILFLNRRGYATLISCKSCGYRFECKHCSVGLIWHKPKNELICHYCGFHCRVPEHCPSCKENQIVRLGMGTQKILEQLADRFPQARIARLDKDTATPKFLEQTVLQMQKRELDLLIGTQMLAKGHDFPWVTLVGVVLADVGMHLPDFRAAERTFQLLTQVAGRAGRAERPGRVLIQTFLPNHSAIQGACLQDAKQFAQEELVFRKAKFYPPYSRMAAVRIDGVDSIQARDTSIRVAQAIREWLTQVPKEVKSNMLGPAPAPLSRLKGNHRHQLFIQMDDTKSLHLLLQKIDGLRSMIPKGIRLHIDVDPTSML